MDYQAYKNVKITGGFFHKKQTLNRKITMQSVWDRFSDTGRIDAFSFSWKEGMDKKPHIFWDSDVAKWMEGAAYIIGKTGDKALEEKVEGLIDLIETNQQPDGYFNIYYTVCEPQNRFTDRHKHELYCAGHLMEAAVAYYEATGKDRFLNCMLRYADCIEKAFITERTASFYTPGHEEIELALLRMYRVTKKQQLLDMAKFFIEERGKHPEEKLCTVQDLPVRTQKEITGHSVRAMYLYAGVAALAKETEDAELWERCRDIFEDVTKRKMYITGGIGSTRNGEAFTVAYDLPNRLAYAETCAAIALVFFCRNMLDLEKKSVYADVLEKVLYNGAYAGLSLDGKAFFYENPLELNIKELNRHIDCYKEWLPKQPITQRKEVFHCSCCPPNLNRFIEESESFLYDVEEKNVYVHLFSESILEKGDVHVETKTDYPNSGTVHFSCKHTDKLYVRIPVWCEKVKISADYTMENGYACIENPDEVTVEFEMKPMLMGANINLSNNIGKGAVCYGPLVYCAEGVDNGENLHALYIEQNLNAKVTYDAELDANVIEAEGYKRTQNTDALYFKYTETFEKTKIRLIPYAWYANRGETDMVVYLHVKQ